MKKIRVGVIGAGHLGRFHTLNYAQIPEADLVGVMDVDKEKAERVAAEAQCNPFYSLEEILNQVEAVSVVVPTDLHHEVGQKVMDKGIHCLVEKPIAQNVKEAEDLVQMANDKGVVLQVGHIERFNPAIRALDEFNMQPQFIESHRLAPFNPRGTEVAVILDLMIHDIDIILYLVKSPITHVDASGVAVVSDTIDIANARIRFQNGCVANLTASRISQKKMRKMRLFQKDTYIGVDFLNKQADVYQLSGDENTSDMVLGEMGVGDKKKQILYKQPVIPEKEGLRTELEIFLDAVRGNPSKQGVSGKAGKAALEIAMKVIDQVNGSVKS